MKEEVSRHSASAKQPPTLVCDLYGNTAHVLLRVLLDFLGAGAACYPAAASLLWAGSG